MLKERLETIKKNITNNQFKQEIDIIDGIIKPILNELNWDIFDIVNTVKSEYSVGNKRVDIALLHQKRPYIFIEAKRIGVIDDKAEEQLLEYAFREGVPMAILTDGKEWNFYIPAAQGPFNERRFYKLDLSQRSTQDSSDTLIRYLLYQAVIKGNALENAKQDYKDAKKNQEIIAKLPEAWQKLVVDKDEILIGLLQEKVSDLCGHTPDDKAVINFLKTLKKHECIEQGKKPTKTKKQDTSNKTPPYFIFKGEKHEAKNNNNLALKIVQMLYAKNLIDLDYISKKLETKSRNFIAKDKNNLYKNENTTPKLKKRYKKINGVWYISTNNSTDVWKAKIKLILKLCNVKGLTIHWRTLK